MCLIVEKLTDEKRDIIFTRLCAGISIRDISDELQVSERTIIRYKKSMLQALEARDNVPDDDFSVDYSKVLTKKESQYVEKIQKELLLYEDVEEGWVYHLSKSDARVRQSGCWWSAIVYPESAPEGWIDKLRAQGFRIAISPLHDKDVWMHDSPEKVDSITGELIPKGATYKIGDKKKAHWHIIVVVDKRTGYLEMNDIIRRFCNCPYIQKCRSLRNSYDYFLHINAPEKCQTYRKEDIQTFNNFHVEPTRYEMNLISMEMVNLIKEHGLNEWWQVVEFFKDDPEMSLILSTRTAFFSSYVKSIHYRDYPNTVKYVETKYVKKFSYEEDEKNGKK